MSEQVYSLLKTFLAVEHAAAFIICDIWAGVTAAIFLYRLFTFKASHSTDKKFLQQLLLIVYIFGTEKATKSLPTYLETRQIDAIDDIKYFTESSCTSAEYGVW